MLRLTAIAAAPIALLFATPTLPGQRQTFGSSCSPNAIFPPTLFALAEPVLGRDIDILLLTSAGSTPASLFVGLSNAQAGPFSLPFALDPFGLPGCELLVSPDFAQALPPNGRLTLPTSLLPTGATVYLQGLTTDTSGSVAGLTGGVELTVPDPFAPFSIAMLPDTQKYSQISSNFYHFTGQVDDVIARSAAGQTAPVRFVSHVGDIVQSGGSILDEWNRAEIAMDRFDGVLPYTSSLGNHDYDVVGNKSDAVQYEARFGTARNQFQPGYVASTSDGRNHAMLFGPAGRRFLHLNIEWRPRDSVLEWAQEQILAWPELPCVVSTHEHLGTGLPASFRTGGSTPDSTGNNAAADVYRKLCEPFPQVFMVLCGHVGGTGRRSDQTILSQSVHQMLADYQFFHEGGNGFYRLIEFDAPNDRLGITTRSATFAPGTSPDFSVEPEHNFDLGYDEFAHRDRLRGQTVRRFRTGQTLGRSTPYTGTQDTFVANGTGTGPNQNRGSDDNVWCDGNQDRSQGLLRFDSVIGFGPDQIPPGTTVSGAILTLTLEGSNAQSVNGATLHRMLVPWSEASTWNSFTGGVQLGTEAVAAADSSTVGRSASKGTLSIDVTASVNAWASGSPNFGWLIQAVGTDGQSFRSSEWAGIVERPMLTVTW